MRNKRLVKSSKEMLKLQKGRLERYQGMLAYETQKQEAMESWEWVKQEREIQRLQIELIKIESEIRILNKQIELWSNEK